MTIDGLSIGAEIEEGLPMSIGLLSCKVFGGVLAIGLLMHSSGAEAQNPWTTQVRQQLVESAVAAGYNGMSFSHEPYTGSLVHGRSKTVDLKLNAGTTYLIAGACDNDCTDLDLKLFDENWNMIDSDIDDDDRPVVAVTPMRTAIFHVRSIMVSCMDSPCAIGLGVFSDE